jgi:membrane-bound serine protease (ClpP class)
MAPQTSFGITTPLVERTSGLTDETLELLRGEVITLLSERSRARGRSEAWIETAVRQGALLNNEQAIAFSPPAVELVARDLEDLLTLLEGRVVTLADGTPRTLATLGQEPQLLEPTLWEWLLLTLANPTVAFMLLVMAGMAIYAELLSPTVGALAGLGLIFLIAAVIGLTALPVRWLAVIGVLLAFGLMAVDLFFPSHGLATLLGLVLLIVSAMTMFDQLQAPGVAIAIWAVILVAMLVTAFAAAGIFLALRMRKTPVKTGQEGLIGRLAEVRRRLEPEGMVFVDGALWRAVSEDGDVEPGEYVRVTGVYELRLTVQRLTPRTER